MKKKKIAAMTILFVMSGLLTGFAINGIKFKPKIDNENNRIMNLNGMGTASEMADTANEAIPSNNIGDEEKDDEDQSAHYEVTRKPSILKEYELSLKIYGVTITQSGVKRSLKDVETISQNDKAIKVYVDCAYGDYLLVEEVQRILGDKFVEVNDDAK